MVNLDNLGRRLAKLEERDAQRQHTWRLSDGRRVTYSAVELFGAYMDLCERVYEAWQRPDEEPPAFEGVLAALANAAEGERERLARRCQWLALWDAEMHRLYSPSPEMLEEV